MSDKSPDAFRTISEVAEWLDTPAHVLRFWESKFTQLKPVKRAGGRRYYRPSDMELLAGIKKLLHEDGMTIRGVQKILREQGVKHVAAMSDREVEPTYDPGPAPAPKPKAAPEPADNVVALPRREAAADEKPDAETDTVTNIFANLTDPDEGAQMSLFAPAADTAPKGPPLPGASPGFHLRLPALSAALRRASPTAIKARQKGLAEPVAALRQLRERIAEAATPAGS